MNILKNLLQAIQVDLHEIIDSTHWNAQQYVFVNHMAQVVQDLQAQVDAIPDHEYAIQQIIPALGDHFLQPQIALYGYGQMLLDYPTSFGGASVPANLRPFVQRIVENGRALAQQTNFIVQQTFQNRMDQRKADATYIDLASLLEENMAIYQYWIKDRPIQLNRQIVGSLPLIVANYYHLSEILRHIIITLAQEVMIFGKIQLRAYAIPKQEMVRLSVQCHGIRLSADEMNTLFVKNGRHLVHKQISKQGAQLHITREAGIGATIHLEWVTAGAKL